MNIYIAPLYTATLLRDYDTSKYRHTAKLQRQLKTKDSVKTMTTFTIIKTAATDNRDVTTNEKIKNGLICKGRTLEDVWKTDSVGCNGRYILSNLTTALNINSVMTFSTI